MLNAKVKCVEGNEFFTKGKIYEVENGCITDDDEEFWDEIDTFEQINKEFSAQFVLVEEQPKQNTYWQNICELNSKQEQKGISKYGQTLEDNTTLSVLQRLEHLQEELLDAMKYTEHLKPVLTDNLTANDYQRMAMRTAGKYKSDYDMLRNAVYGLNGEAGEVIDLLKKHEFQGHELDKEKLIDEAGDVAWYIALLAQALGMTLQDILQHNVNKLMKRYPNGFDKSRSINRTPSDET